MIVLVSKLISLTVHSNVNSTCSGTENRTLAFVFDACHEDLLTSKGAFLLATQQSLGSAVNCTVQICEARASNLSSSVTRRKKIQVL